MAERLTFEGNFCEIARCRETRWGKHCPDGACSQRKVWERLKEYEDAISADIAPVVHGEWIESCPLLECQSCGEIYSRLGGNAGKLWNYCPNCGARMTEDIAE